jgi:hypothetical protein
LAAQHGHVAATSLLLQQGCSVDAVMLHRTAFSGAVATLRLLLIQDGGSRLLLLLAKDETFGDLRTPLHKAAAGGRYLAVQLLLDTLREHMLLDEALRIKDAGQQTPLEIASQLLKVQDEERQSVARWDQVAGGVADWTKCVQLLKSAAGGNWESQSQGRSKPQMEVPKHLTRINRDGCIDCTDTTGKCLTASWQAAFQAALGSSVETTMLDSGSNFDNQTSPSEPLTNTGESPAIQTEALVQQSTRLPVPKPSATGTSQSKGILCSSCGQPSIALYPAKGKGLICKPCKRKSQ